MLRKIYLFTLCLLFTSMTSQACNIDIYANQNMKPKIYIEDGKPAGILVEMMSFIAQDINCQFNYKFSTWARAYKNMLNGKGAVIGISKGLSREKLINYSDAIFTEEMLLVTHIDNVFQYNNIDDLLGKTVIASRGAYFGDKFEQAVMNKLLTFVPDNGDIAKRLERVARGRVDIAIISPGKYAFKNAFIKHSELLALKDQLYIVPTVFRRDLNFLGFSKKHNHKAFLEKFNLSLKKGHQSGAFKAIKDKYLQLQ